MNHCIKIIALIFLLAPGKLEAGSPKDAIDSVKMQKCYDAALKLYASGLYTEALDSFKYAFDTGKRIYSEDHYALRRINNALGITYRNTGQYDNAITHFLFVEHAYLSQSHRNEVAIARLYNNIGNVYYNKINYGTALEYYQRATNIFLNQKQINYEGVAEIFYSIANIHYKLNNYEKALEITRKYLQHADPETKLFFLNLKSAIFQLLGLYNEAYKSYTEAIEHSKKIYSESDLNVIFEYLNFASFLIENSHFDDAGNVLKDAKTILTGRNIADGLTLALYYKTMGNLNENINVESTNIDDFRQQKSINLSMAIEYYKKGLESLNFDITAISGETGEKKTGISLTQSLNFLKLIADTYVSLAELYEENMKDNYSGAILSALDYYDITSNLIQKARKEIYSDNNKIQLSELEESTFNKIIQTAYKAYMIKGDYKYFELAFQNAERQKASSVFDKLTDQLAKENSLIPDSLTELEKTLNYTITNYNEKLYDLSKSENSSRAETEQTDSLLFLLKKQRDELNRYLEMNYKEYYDLKYSNTTINIYDIQNKLKNDEVIIEYVINDNDSVPEIYSFFISKSYAEFKKLNISSSFEYSLEKTFRFLSDPHFMFTKNSDSREFCVASHNLYNDLISPVKYAIINKKITIIPDGKLAYLPFDALLEELPDTSGLIQFQRLKYLIRTNTVNYAYSANLLINFSKLKKVSKNRILAFAPEYNSDTVSFEDENFILLPLPGTKKEVELISQEIKTHIYAGNSASEKNFRENCNNYDILHLAMHAFINDSLPAFSRFAFAPGTELSNENDGWLNTADIYNLDLNSRLTVLSACNTGRGSLRKGEGVMSLARGFIYAGCPSIVMSLWEVEDNAGTQIMNSFYRNLKKGKRTDDALRLSKLEYLENANPRMAHPHYWLSYVNIGNSSPLFRSYDFYFFLILLIALFAIITDQFIRFRKNRKDTSDEKEEK